MKTHIVVKDFSQACDPDSPEEIGSFTAGTGSYPRPEQKEVREMLTIASSVEGPGVQSPVLTAVALMLVAKEYRASTLLVKELGSCKLETSAH